MNMADSLPIRLDDTVQNKSPTLYVVTRIVAGVRPGPPSPRLEARKQEILDAWAGVDEAQLEEHAHITTYRELQRQLGGDPKMMPAVEGMLRRGVLRGRFPTINSVVDATNVVSLTHLAPIGAFDFDRIHAGVELALSTPGDRLIPIGKEKPVKLKAGTPVLKDREGIFSAVGSRDARRTMITEDTENVLAFSWGIEGIDPGFLASVLDQCHSMLMEEATRE
jgi:DNA/RNA-binding domain of Phe-tRNA-synthetase-like protein